MTLRLYNTLTKTKEDFTPDNPANVRMYVCGPTVYDFAHIGNARPVIVFDVLFRLLKHLYPGAGNASDGSRVTYVRNVTDVDDKINARAAEIAAGKNISVEQARAELTATTERQFVEDVTALGCLPPTHTPRATDNIAEMIAMIEKLVANGHAYPKEGHVLFRVSSKPDYGKLARRSLDEMIAGARIEVAPFKEDAMDFVLWKPSDPATPGWDSPWGRGRPGWHIECSAMAGRYLGETFDIHGGGIDLVFPHHENEIAQSEAAHHGHPLAKVWMHNGFLQVEGEKMAKSAGNFVTIRELLNEGWGGSLPWDGDSLRFAMLSTHYRQPIDWTMKRLSMAWYALETFMSLGRRHLGFDFQTDIAEDEGIRNTPVSTKMLANLTDDLNTPAAQAHLFSLAEAAKNDGVHGKEASRQLLADCLFIGVDPFRSIRNLRSLKSVEDVALVEILIGKRNDARAARDFKESDRIRDALLAQGIVLKDGPNGTTWEVKR